MSTREQNTQSRHFCSSTMPSIRYCDYAKALGWSSSSLNHTAINQTKNRTPQIWSSFFIEAMNHPQLHRVNPLAPEIHPEDFIVAQRINTDAQRFSQDPDAFAEQQGKGIAEHLELYANGTETRFERYFVIADEHHAKIHKSFLQEVTAVVTNTIHNKDEPRIIRLELGGMHIGLLARTDLDSEGNEFGVHYEAYVLMNRTQEQLGKISTALAMQ